MTKKLTNKKEIKVLISGWFSFKEMGATAGDLYCKDVISDWLRASHIPFEVALEAPFRGGIRWQDCDPNEYSHIIFTCGPFGNGEPLIPFLEHFKGCSLIGINLSMLQDLKEWNPFDLLIERDSSRTTHPDLVFLSHIKKVPVVGLILVEPQKEYKDKARHRQANQRIRELLDRQDCSIVPIDTRLDVPNKGGLRTPNEIESLIAKMDAVVTTRLHGMVLSIKNNVPVLAVDAIVGGAKVSQQAHVIEWPNVLQVEKIGNTSLSDGYNFCFTPKAKACLTRSSKLAVQKLASVEKQTIQKIKGQS